jgi:ArsR family transcriptional regulator, arsenate/arsenite/antimonite-responsive transcriptional repressor
MIADIFTIVNTSPGRILVARGRTEPCCTSVLEAPLGEAEADELAQAFAALADPVRLRLLSFIAAAGEVCSCDLLVPLDRSQPTVSHHTKVLADAGLIAGEKRGRWVWWSVVSGRVAEVREALAPADAVPA